jgi:DeoR family transcriptional regulator, fructose operon transcriptional repressor
MKKRAQTERRDTIRRLLAQEGSLRVEDLAAWLDVTTMTVRRDLGALEEEGVLVRTHGGCTVQAPMVRELSFSEKDALRARQKAAIARAAVERIAPESSVYIDTGTTTLHFARALPSHLRLRIFTNNLRVAMDLFGREGIEVVVYGGRLRQSSPDLAGEIALGRVQEYRLDVAVLGADAVDTGRGEVYGADMLTTSLDRAVLRQSSRALILADSSKLGKHSLSLVTKLHAGIALITDDEADPQDVRALQQTDADIVVAVTDSEEYPLHFAAGGA